MKLKPFKIYLMMGGELLETNYKLTYSKIKKRLKNLI